MLQYNIKTQYSCKIRCTLHTCKNQVLIFIFVLGVYTMFYASDLILWRILGMKNSNSKTTQRGYPVWIIRYLDRGRIGTQYLRNSSLRTFYYTNMLCYWGTNIFKQVKLLNSSLIHIIFPYNFVKEFTLFSPFVTNFHLPSFRVWKSETKLWAWIWHNTNKLWLYVVLFVHNYTQVD
jgi:hypothetical protein